MGITITYKNILDGQRYTLFDNLSETEAKQIMSGPFNDKANPFTYLPGLRMEK